MCIMAVRAYTLLEGSMHVSLSEKIFDAFMTTQTKGIHVLFYQILEVTCVYIMTGFSLPLFEGKMDITLGKSLLKRFMAGTTEGRNFFLVAYSWHALQSPFAKGACLTVLRRPGFSVTCGS